MAAILLVEDDETMSRALARLMERLNHEVTPAPTLAEARSHSGAREFDLVLLDIRLPDGNGLDLLAELKRGETGPEVIILTGNGDPDGAELAIRNGAWDFLVKPAGGKEIELTLERALAYRAQKESGRTRLLLKREGIVGGGAAITRALGELARAAASSGPVLLTGETGTGKELFARALHKNSPRADGPLVVIDCAGLPESLVESELFGHKQGAFTGATRAAAGLIAPAHGGTLVLDEIGELPPGAQKPLLRVLQEKKIRALGSTEERAVDFRLVCATHRDLSAMVRDGAFREDLYYRIRGVQIEIPPLRERREDIRELFLHYMDRVCRRDGVETRGFTPEFIHMLEAYDWPGNVRELLQSVEQSIARAGSEPTLYPMHLPTSIRVNVVRAATITQENSARKNASPAAATPPTAAAAAAAAEAPLTFREFRESALSAAEGKYFQQLMQAANDDITEAMRLSGLSRARLYELLKKHNLRG